jgi:hypothetical protein
MERNRTGILTCAMIASIWSFEGCCDLSAVVIALMMSTNTVNGTAIMEGMRLTIFLLSSLALHLDVVPNDPCTHFVTREMLEMHVVIARTLHDTQINQSFGI